MPRKGGFFVNPTFRKPESDRERGIAPRERIPEGEAQTVRDALDAAGLDAKTYVDLVAEKLRIPKDVRDFVQALLVERVSPQISKEGRSRQVIAKEASAFLDELLVEIFLQAKGRELKKEGRSRTVKLSNYHTENPDWED